MGSLVEFPRRFDPSGEAWNPLLTKAQAALLLGRSTRWVEMQHSHGIPRVVGAGGRSLYPHDELVAWWRARRAS